MRAIYETICEIFDLEKPLFQEYELKPVMHIDLFNGQYVTHVPDRAHHMPALFYDWTVAWDPMRNNTQSGLCTVQIYIALEDYSDSSADSKSRDLALDVFNYCTVIDLLLHGLSGEEFTPLVCIGEKSVDVLTNVKLYLFEYTCTVTKKITMRTRNFLHKKLDDLKLSPAEIKEQGEELPQQQGESVYII